MFPSKKLLSSATAVTIPSGPQNTGSGGIPLTLREEKQPRLDAYAASVRALSSQLSDTQPSLTQRAKNSSPRELTDIQTAARHHRDHSISRFIGRWQNPFKVAAYQAVITEAVHHLIQTKSTTPELPVKTSIQFINVMDTMGITRDKAYDRFKSEAKKLTRLQERMTLAQAALPSPKVAKLEAKMMEAWIIYTAFLTVQLPPEDQFQRVFSNSRNARFQMTAPKRPGALDRTRLDVPLFRSFSDLPKKEYKEVVRHCANMVRGYEASYLQPALTPDHLAVQKSLSFKDGIFDDVHTDWLSKELRMVVFFRAQILDKDRATRENAIRFIHKVANELLATRDISGYLTLYFAVSSVNTDPRKPDPLISRLFPGIPFATFSNVSPERLMYRAGAVCLPPNANSLSIFFERHGSEDAGKSTLSQLCRLSEDLSFFTANPSFELALDTETSPLSFDEYYALISAQKRLFQLRTSELTAEEVEKCKEVAGIITAHASRASSQAGSRTTLSGAPSRQSPIPLSKASSRSSFTLGLEPLMEVNDSEASDFTGKAKDLTA